MKVLAAKRKSRPLDAEQCQFAVDVLESIRQAGRGEFVAVHYPEDIVARKAGASEVSESMATIERAL